MKKIWFCTLVMLAVWSAPAFGERVHLFSGDVISGRITETDGETISIESAKGFGVIQIARSEISLIEFEDSKRDLERKIGFGYFHRTTPNTADGSAMEYAVDAFSIKYWLSRLGAIDFLVGFFSYDEAGTTKFEVFSMDIRYTRVFQRKSQFDFYWGGSYGYLAVNDQTLATPIEDNGTSVRAFMGAEVFFLTLPGLGFSAEVGFGSQSVGSRQITNVSTTTFPTFSMRYYF